MATRITRVLTTAERDQMNEEALARGLYRDDRRVFLPGMAWFCPWYWDPHGELKEHVRTQKRPDDPNKRGFLSPHYWKDWSDKRPPITVVCPNGEQWCVDQWSSNGTGWTVTGELPNITCAPSIVVPGYHGFLQAGAFTADCDGRPPDGVVLSKEDRVAWWDKHGG